MTVGVDVECPQKTLVAEFMDFSINIYSSSEFVTELK